MAVDVLRGRVTLVAGATLGAGRGIAVGLAALGPDREPGLPTAPAGFASSESPRYLGRGVAALAADHDRARWNQHSVTSADLARAYGITDLDGRTPDSWA